MAMGSRDSTWFRTNTERSTLERCRKTVIDVVLGAHRGGMAKGDLSHQQVRGSFAGTMTCSSTHWLPNPCPQAGSSLVLGLEAVPTVLPTSSLRGSLRSSSTIPGTERQSFILWLLCTAPCLSPAIAGHKPTGRCSSLFNIGEWACTEWQPSTKPQLSLNSAKIM